MRFSTSSKLVSALLAASMLVFAGCRDDDDDPAPVPAPATPSAPTISGVNPASGDVAGGTTVTVNGTNFLTGATVTFAGAGATVTSVTSTQIVVSTPAGAQGPATVVVTNTDTGSATLTNGFTYTSGGSGGTPTISSTTPASGPAAGGTTITIAGTGFVAGATVTVGGTSATGVVVVSGVQITAVTPAGTGSSQDVVVNNPVSGTATDTGAWSWIQPPTVSTVTPNNGAPAGGNTVTIGGSNFQSGATVLFGGNAGTNVTFVSAASIEVDVPAGSVGTVGVTVTNPDTQNDTLASAYTYNAAPTVVSLDVTSGTTAGGTAVNITGTGFLTGATVLFGGNAATSVVVNSATSISCNTPAGSAGTVAVTVTNTDSQSGQLASAFTYTTGGGGNPTVTAISPSSGTTNGGTPVTITGTNFLLGATVTIGGNAVTGVMVLNTTTITGVTPAGSGTSLNVAVNNPGGGSGQAALWSYTASGTAPTVTSLSPASSGIAAGGTTVTINGSNFSTPTVTIDGVNQPVSSSTASTVVITTAGAGPCGPGGARDVKVTNGNGETGTGSSLWTYTHNIPEGLSPACNTPDIVVDGAGTIHVVWSVDTGSSNSDIMHVRSTDGGKTWTSTPNRITNSTNPSITPKLAANGNTVVLVWDEQATTHRVQYTYSTDNGQNWATNANLPVGSANGLALAAAPDVAIDGNGQITAAWLCLGPTPPPPSLAGPDVEVWTASGTTTGIASATASKRSGTGTIMTGVAVAADGNGNAIVVWGQGFNGSVVQLPDDVLVSRTTNGGTSWSAASQIHSGSSSSLSGTPAVALRGTSAVIAFCEMSAGPQYACLSYRSTDTGGSWASGGALRAAASNVVTTAAVAADANGWFMATWSDQGASQTNIFCAQSSDVGTTWTTGQAFNPTANASSVPQIAGGAAGVWKHVWTEFNAGGNDVRQW